MNSRLFSCTLFSITSKGLISYEYAYYLNGLKRISSIMFGHPWFRARRLSAPVKTAFPVKGKIVQFASTKQGIDGYLVYLGN